MRSGSSRRGQPQASSKPPKAPKKNLAIQNSFSYGASFSSKYACELGIDPRAAYLAILNELQLDRLRLMSYWDEIETTPGKYDFDELDWQVRQAAKHQVNITLCLGMRQPRWPECHLPNWAKQLNKADRHKALYKFLEKVVDRYKLEDIIESWQLENEAFNRGIGLCEDYDRRRLQAEYALVKKLDPGRPIIMSTSNTLAWQIRRPRPDIVGFSIYMSQHRNGKYYFSKLPAWWYRLKAWLIITFLHIPVIIHELQAEPWGAGATAKLSRPEQALSMDAKKLCKIIAYAQKTSIKHLDFWGAEWWYWQKAKHGDDLCWKIVKNLAKQK